MPALKRGCRIVTSNCLNENELEVQVRKRIAELERSNQALSVEILQYKQKEHEREKAEKALHDSEERYRSLYENSLDGILLTKPDGTILSANPQACKLFGMTEDDIIQAGREGLVIKNEALAASLEERELTGRSRAELICRRKDGSTFACDVTSNLFKDADGSIKTSMIIRDITERKHAEEALKKTHQNLEEKVKERTAELEKSYNSLKESEKRLDEAQKLAHVGHWEWTIAIDKTYWSDELYRIFGRDPNEPYPTCQEFLNYIHPEDRDYVNSTANRAMNGKPYSIDYRIIRANREERAVHMQSQVIFDKNNIPVQIKGIVQDITERKKSEEKLRESESRLRHFYESNLIGVFYYNLDGSIIEANNKLLEIVGYTREDLQAGRIKLNKTTPPEYRHLDENAAAELKATGMNTPYEKEYIRKDGSRVPVIVGVAAFDQTRNEGVAFILDITEKKEAEEALANIETARKKEIHHRIKNNLQVISSLLDLQTEKFGNREFIKNSEIMEAFRESQNRVKSMALIHEELYKGEETDTLNFSPYIEELAENLFQTYRLGNINISLDMDLEENVFLDMDTAVPLGIITNELVSNSLKHAFLSRDKGEIQIKFHRDESKSEGCKSDNFILTVSDNGIGIPEDLNIEEIDSLGFQLVTSLVEQLDGKLELKRDMGTEFIIRFTVTGKSNQTSPYDNEFNNA